MFEFMRPWIDASPAVAGALVVLLAGFIGATALKGLAQTGLGKLRVNERIQSWGKWPAGEAPDLEDIGARLVYVIALLFVAMAFLEVFHLTMLADPLKQLLGTVFIYGTRFFGALILVLIAWLLAKLLRAGTLRLLQTMQVDQRLEERLPNVAVAATVSDLVYGLVFLFFLPAILDALALPGLLGPVNTLITKLLAFLPNLAGAVILLLVAWALAQTLRSVVQGLLGPMKLEERLDIGPGVSVVQLIGNLAYGLVFLFFLPGVLGALALDGLLVPVNALMNKVILVLPNLAAATVLCLVAWLAARFVRTVSTNILRSTGLDEKTADYLNQVSLVKAVGEALYALTLLLFLPAILDALALQGLLVPINGMIEKILGFLPNLLAAGVVVLVSYVVGRIAANLVTSLLAGTGFDAFLGKVGFVQAEGSAYKPSDIAGMVVLAWILLVACMEAAHTLGFVLLADLAAKFTVFASQVLLGVLIFAIGLYLANLAQRAILGSRAVHAALLATAARCGILILSGAMALREMGIAGDIINLAFGLLLGAVAVAIALAFGLGGKETARQQLNHWTECMEKEKEKK